ncbi:MAG: hypothetical protein WC490_01745 [Candidatus Margulisiibacteriota bacterium]
MPAKAAKKSEAKKPKKEKIAGKIDHYFDKIKVITTTLKAPIKVGDIIHIKGHTTDFVQPVGSIQIEHESVQKAKKGEGVGIKVKEFVRDNDIIYFADKKSADAQKPQIQPMLLQKSAAVKTSVPRTPSRDAASGRPRFLSF